MGNKLITETHNLTIEEITDIIQNNGNVEAFMSGQFSEAHFKKLVATVPSITHFYKPDDNAINDKGDLVVTYKNTPIRFEVKNIRKHGTNLKQAPTCHNTVYGSYWSGWFQIKGSRSHTLKFADGSVARTYNVFRGQYDVITVCVRPFTGKYEFMYCLEKHIPCLEPSSKITETQAKELLQGTVKVQWPPVSPWTDSLEDILEQAYLAKTGTV